VFLLTAAIGVDVAVVIVIVDLADRHPLVQVLEIDRTFCGFVVVDFHKIPPFVVFRNGGICRANREIGMKTRPQSLRISPFRIAALPLKGKL
jgi:hypothetical protein